MDRVYKPIIIAAMAVIVIAGLKSAESLVVPMLMSVFLAVLCEPVLEWLKAKRVPTALAITIIMVSVLLLFGAMSVLLSASFGEFTTQLPEYQERLRTIVDGLLVNVSSILGHFGVSADLAGTFKEMFDPGMAMQVVSSTLGQFGSMMTNIFLILLTTIFILSEIAVLGGKLDQLPGSTEKTRHALERFSDTINRYMAIKLWVSALTGALVWLLLMIIGTDYPLLWGVVAMLLNFVPNLGSIIAAIPPVLLTIVQLGFGEAGAVALGFLAINTIIGNALEPKFMGKGLDLSALVVFLSLVFWGWVLGPVGMLLSVPLTMTVKIALESFDETRWIGTFLGAGTEAKAEVAIEADPEVAETESK